MLTRLTRGILRRWPQQYLNKLQRRHPPLDIPQLSGREHVRWVFSGLEGRLPAAVQRLFEEGTVAIGEIGIPQPDAYVERLWPGGYVIQFQTGMWQFLYRVSRALHGSVNVFEPDGKQVAHATAFDQAVLVLSAVFKNFMRDGSVRGPSIYTVSAEQVGIASALATHAEAFIIAHEIGHVLGWLADGRGETLSSADEYSADGRALELVLGWNADSPAVRNRRMEYAGAEFAVRVYASLQHVGYRFKETHPAPDQRLLRLRARAEAMCGSYRKFMTLSTIAFAFDQLLEAVEQRLAQPSQARPIGPTPQQVLSGFLAVFEAYSKGQVSEADVVAHLLAVSQATPEAIMREAAQAAAAMCTAAPEHSKGNDLTQSVDHEVNAALARILKFIPDDLSKFFSHESPGEES